MSHVLRLNVAVANGVSLKAGTEIKKGDDHFETLLKEGFLKEAPAAEAVVEVPPAGEEGDKNETAEEKSEAPSEAPAAEAKQNNRRNR